MVSNKKKAVIVWVLALLLVAGVGIAAFLLVKEDSSQGKDTDKTAVQSQLNDAVELSMSGKCEEAVSSLENILTKSSEFPEINAEAKLRAGQCYMTLKKFQQAATKLDEASKQFTDLGDGPKQAQSAALYQQAATETLNSQKSDPQVNSSEPRPSEPPVW